MIKNFKKDRKEIMSLGWQAEVEQTVIGLGYTLVDAERLSNGMLRVFIEHPQGDPAITIDDCERVTRQLQYVLEANEIDYQRLEVSSAGLDRPLKIEGDYLRFLGEEIDVTFKRAVDLISANGKPYQQKKFIGRLDKSQDEKHDWVLLLTQEPKKKSTHGKKDETNEVAQGDAVTVLGFTLDEVREARLVPVVNFKGPQK